MEALRVRIADDTDGGTARGMADIRHIGREIRAERFSAHARERSEMHLVRGGPCRLNRKRNARRDLACARARTEKHGLAAGIGAVRRVGKRHAFKILGNTQSITCVFSSVLIKTYHANPSTTIKSAFTTNNFCL